MIPFRADLSDLWQWSGRLHRLPYLAWGLGLFFIKYVIDRNIAHSFGREWGPMDYLAPGQAFGSLLNMGPDRKFFAAMWLAALPFIATGIVLTVQRLRAARLHPALVLLFFLPVANLLFFLVLSLLPSLPRAEVVAPAPPPLPSTDQRAAGESNPDAILLAHAYAPPAVPLGYGRPSPRPGPVARLFPENAALSLLVSVLVPLPFLLLLTVTSVTALGSYGWGVFVGLPFANGMAAAALHGVRVPRTFGQAMAAGSLSLLVAGLGILCFAIEGAVCLIMLIPLALPVALVGAALGYAIQRRPQPQGLVWRPLAGVLLFLPAHMAAERWARPAAPVFRVTSAVDVDAPPRQVWRHVVSFGDLPPPREAMFRAGVAYPVRARIDGHGVGAVRHCVFSTGAFVEPIEVWDEPRLLKFSVVSSPPPMREWTFYRDVHPPHLENFLVSKGGQFRLIELPGGRTRLEGTTWYQHRMWPSTYWRLWSDGIIGTIHVRVLDHIRQLSETDAGPQQPPEAVADVTHG